MVSWHGRRRVAMQLAGAVLVLWLPTKHEGRNMVTVGAALRGRPGRMVCFSGGGEAGN
jgi:hypothetical protein